MKKQPILVASSIPVVLILVLPACTETPSATPPTQPVSTQTRTAAQVPTDPPTKAVVSISSPTPENASGVILFISNMDGDYEVYAMELGAALPIQLTFNEEWDCCADWSPDGTKIVFSSVRADNWDLYLLDLSTGSETRLTREGGLDTSPSWSPDGNRIAFTSDRGGKSDIYMMNADGSQQGRLTEDENVNSDPDWSPDGARIVYTSVNYTNSPAATEDLYVMDAAGGQPFQLTKNDVQELDPAWSPDGTSIAFTSTPSHDSDEYNLGIYVVDLKGDITQLTFDDTWEANPTWSPDGMRLAYSWCPDERWDGCSIYVMNKDGSHSKKVIDLPSGAGGASWLSKEKIVLTPDCTAGWSKLFIGDYAAVAGENDTPNRVRSGPSLADEVITQVYPGTPLKVVEGPVCADGLIFWKVEHKSIPGGAGWTAEGDGKDYWLVPFTQ